MDTLRGGAHGACNSHSILELTDDIPKIIVAACVVVHRMPGKAGVRLSRCPCLASRGVIAAIIVHLTRITVVRLIKRLLVALRVCRISAASTGAALYHHLGQKSIRFGRFEFVVRQTLFERAATCVMWQACSEVDPVDLL